METVGFSATQILREINYGHIEAHKAAILTISAVLKFNFWELLTIPSVLIILKSKFKASKIVKTAVFYLLK